MDKSVIIIGGGLAGLQCGYILAKHGLGVTVLEQGRHIGGCLQSFVRSGAVFESGFHYVGGLAEGQPLHTLFNYLDLLDLPWRQLDEDCFDEVVIGNESFPFANGHERFAERLIERFPAEKEGILKYTSFLKNVGDHIFDSFAPRDASDFYSTSLFAKSAYEFVNETIGDPLLRKVLSGTSLKMELNAESLPLYVFAQINNSFIQSAWRLQGGGSLIAEHLTNSIKQMGGHVLTDALVTSMQVENGRIARVIVNFGQPYLWSGEGVFEADWVISSAHPASTVSLIEQTDSLRNIYRKRLGALENTYGMFTANIVLKDDTLPYLNKNIFVHSSQADLWDPKPDVTQSVLVSYTLPLEEEARKASAKCFAKSVDLLSPMSWAEVEPWSKMKPGHRGEEYVEFKQRKLRDCFDLVGKRLPELEEAAAQVFTSTPLTYNSYLLQPQGSAYGVRKDWRSTMTTVLAPTTPIPNLLLTGQSLNLHGVLGVSMTSVFTCGAILGMESLAKEIMSNGK